MVCKYAKCYDPVEYVFACAIELVSCAGAQHQPEKTVTTWRLVVLDFFTVTPYFYAHTLQCDRLIEIKWHG